MRRNQGRAFILRRNRRIALLGGLILVVFLAVLSAGASQSDTVALTVSFQGLRLNSLAQWQAVPLSGRFTVLAGDTALGEIGANLTAEQREAGQRDILDISREDAGKGLSLRPVPDTMPSLYVCQETVPIGWNGEGSVRAEVVAYAREGLFRVETDLEISSQPDGNTPSVQNKSASFEVRDAQGQAVLAFETDAEGRYTARTTLPEGSYTLRQSYAPQGAVPAADVAFSIAPYLGTEDSVSLVPVVNAAVPAQSALSTGLSVKTAPAGDLYAADQTAEYLISFDGSLGNTLPLKNFTLDLGPLTLLDGSQNALPSQAGRELQKLAVTPGTAGIKAKVYILDAQGNQIGNETLLAAGQEMDVSGRNAVSVRIVYVTADGQPTVPEAFRMGEVRLSVGLKKRTPGAAVASVAYAGIPVKTAWQYEYPDRDGNLVTAAGGDKPLNMLAKVGDSRTVLSVWASAAAGGRLRLTVKNESGAAVANPRLAVKLPEGWRVTGTSFDAPIAAVSHGAESDLLFLSFEGALEAGQELPAEVAASFGGESGECEAWILSGTGLAATLDNPAGLTVWGAEAQAFPAADLYFALAQPGTYAHTFFTADSAGFEGQAAQGNAFADSAALTGVLFDDANGSGSKEGDEQGAADRLVLWRGGAVGYHAVTDTQGIFGFSGMTDDETGDLYVSLPENTAIAGQRGPGGLYLAGSYALSKKTEVQIGFSRMCALSGTVYEALSETGIPGVTVTLARDGKAISAVQTDAQGKYRFDGLAQGAYQVSLELPADTAAVLGFDPLDGYASVEDRKALFPETVLSYGGEARLDAPVRGFGGVEVTFMGEISGISGVALFRDGAQVAQLEKMGEGLFAKDGLFSGTYDLILEVQGGLALRREGEQAWRKGSVSLEMQVKAGTNSRLSADVTETGALLLQFPGGAAGSAVTLAGPEDQNGVLDENGECVFEDLIPGVYTATVLLPGDVLSDQAGAWLVAQGTQGASASRQVEVLSGQKTVPVAAELVRMASLSGTVFGDSDLNGEKSPEETPISGAQITLSVEEQGIWTEVQTLRTGADGGYSIAGLAPGRYRLEASLPDGKAPADASFSEPFLLESAANLVRDLGAVSSASIHANAFWDSDNSGIQGIYERAIEGTLVEVIPAEGGEDALYTGETNRDGTVRIDGVTPGSYRIRFTLPDNYWLSEKGAGQGLDRNTVPIADSSRGVTEAFTLYEGQSLGFGVGGFKTASIGGRVFLDGDGDGIMGDAESGLAGCRLTMANTRSNEVYAYVTDGTGLYHITVRPGGYTLQVEGPEGMAFTGYSATGGSRRSILTAEGARTGEKDYVLSSGEQEENENIGFVVGAVLEGKAYLDANYNGWWDEGETPLASVTLQLLKAANSRSIGTVVTGADGAFRFDSLRAGDYRLKAALPATGAVYSRAPGKDGSYANQFGPRLASRENAVAFSIAAGDRLEMGVGAVMPGSLAGSVFEDANFNGLMDKNEGVLAGVTVSLNDGSGAVIGSTVTDASGRYAFEGLMPMTYTLAVQKPAGYMFTVQGQGTGRSHVLDSKGITEAVTVAMGQQVSGIHAGLIKPGSIKGQIFGDANDDGVESQGESGFPGVTVTLTDGVGTAVQSTVTGADGIYLFDELTPGEYKLVYLLPDDTVYAKVTASGSRISGDGLAAAGESFRLAMGETKAAPLCGAVALARITGTAFHDVNGSGLWEQGEGTLSSVRLALAGPDGAAYEAVTGTDGIFALTGLRPGTYTLSVSLPGGMIFTKQTANALTGPVLSKEADVSLQIAMGQRLEGRLVGGVLPASLGGTVWLDENNDGRMTAGEASMAGLTVQVTDSGDGSLAATVPTGENGVWVVPVIQPGAYDIRVLLPERSAAADTAAGENLFADAEPGAIALKGFLLREGEEIFNVTAGIRQYAFLSGRVWADMGGQIASLGGAQVALYEAADLDTPLSTATTGEDGSYRFEGLLPGDYILGAVLPGGYLFVKPGDARLAQDTSVIADTQGGMGEAFHLFMGKDQTGLDIGGVKTGRLGDMAWLDENGNGLQDAGEPGIPGLTVVLVQDGAEVQETVTDAYGYYLFENVYPAAGILRVTMYAELLPTERREDFPLLVSSLSGYDGSTAYTVDVTVESDGFNYNCDLGFVLKEGAKKPAAIVDPPKQNWE